MLEGIVFDLDGTLWDTKESYLYSYEKISEKYHIVDKKGPEDIVQMLGVKLRDVMNFLFADFENKDVIAEDAVNFSIECILKNSDVLYPNVKEMIIKLSKDYKIYIISNCPRNYLETFLSISNLKEYITDSYTITEGNKIENFQKIINQNKGKLLFVGDDYEDYQTIKDHGKTFFCYAKYGYKKSDTYDYSITTFEKINNVLESINEKERILLNKPYQIISYLDSNLTLIKKSDDTYYFGFLNLSNEEENKIMIDRLKTWISSHQFKDLIGPINGNTYFNYRFAIDQFNWVLYPDCTNSLDDYLLFINAGFEICHRYSSTLASIHQRIWDKGKKVTLKNNFKVKMLHGKECYNHLEEIYDIAVSSFKDADYYEEISKEDFMTLYIKNIQECNPDLVLIYDNEKPIALNFCYEDLLKRFYVCKTTAIKKEYRNMKMILKLIDYSYQMMVEKGYQEVLYHFQNQETKTLFPIFKGHQIKQKHYALLRYKNEK